MARGVEGKLRQRTAKAETRQKEKDEASVEYDGEVIEMFPDSLINSASSGKQGGGCCGGSTAPPPPKVSVEDKINKAKREREAKSEGKDDSFMGYLRQIETLPLVFLVLLCGGGLLPVILKIYDNFSLPGNMTGNLGYRLGIGQTPKMRVTSFYEKHSPEQLDKIPSIMSKYYGDYGALTKKLERKYQDYGYFINWENDEAPSTMAWQKGVDTYNVINKYYRKNAPDAVKKITSNIYINGNMAYKKGRKIWRKYLAPYLSLNPDPAAVEKQKKKDRESTRGGGGAKKKRKKGNHAFRDEEE